ncbi:T9SS type A sorting domain-containing protein [Polluticoccus soli]|uniref:T9SS type A sorting domain-containing protein n=1 Tax=Polluticoccus soli TaxID=3034150 RepID=UPI0023E12AC3|nr:T9SS type A sorting domain-containing protein [Flavipsychrobacter sp. JY13-12]
MRKLLLLSIYCSMMAFLPKGQAQFQGQLFHFNPDTKVFAWGQEKTLAWCGGANNPQFSLADLNNDQKVDLVINEPYVGVKTFLNTGNANYVYSPQFEYNFPFIQGYMKLADYNDDGIADLFQRGSTGFAVYKGRFENGELKFSFYRELFYNSVSGWVNAYCEPNDMPGIEDIDHDGDLDFVSFYIGGGKITWYRNCREEDGLPNDSIRVCVKDNCWGKTFQGIYRTHLLHTTCDTWGTSCKGCEDNGTGNKTTHTGNAICLLDYDGDGDFDYFDGSVSYPDVQLLTNGRKDFNFSIDSMMWQDTMWNSNGHQLHMPVWPGGYWLDIDQDHDKDLLFSPNASNTENYKCIAHYKNVGTDASPNFVYQSDTFLIEKMIDVGSGSYPVFYDYDKDGKLDLFVGSDGFYQPDGTLKGKVSYYRNIGTGSNYSFELQTMDFMQIGNYLFRGTSIAIGDIDDDGKDDLVLGHTDGTLSYFKNQAASNTVQPVWNLVAPTLKDALGNDIVVTNYAAPVIYDMNKDGKKDLVIGNMTGYLTYYESASVGGNISLNFKTNKLGDAHADPNAINIYTMSAPYIGRMDNTGIDYLVMGSQDGKIFRFDGFQNGNVTTPYTMIDSNYSFVKAGTRTAPTFADLDGDNKYEMIVGNVLGGLSFYKQLFNVDVKDINTVGLNVKLYPNPANNVLNVELKLPHGSDGDVQIHVLSALGQRVISSVVPATQAYVQLSTSGLSSGVYYCVVQYGSQRSAQPVTITR